MRNCAHEPTHTQHTTRCVPRTLVLSPCPGRGSYDWLWLSLPPALFIGSGICSRKRGWSVTMTPARPARHQSIQPSARSRWKSMRTALRLRFRQSPTKPNEIDCRRLSSPRNHSMVRQAVPILRASCASVSRNTASGSAHDGQLLLFVVVSTHFLLCC